MERLCTSADLIRSWFERFGAASINRCRAHLSRNATLPVVPICRTSLALRCRANHNDALARLAPIRGAARDRHGRWVWDAMDAVASGAIIARTNDAATYGEVVWSWRSDAGAKLAKMLTRLADDGGKKAWSPERARRKPLKPLRAGMPVDSGGPAALPLCFLIAQAATGGVPSMNDSLEVEVLCPA
jgi:hypothetical protein